MKIRRIAATVLAVTSLVGGLTACGNSSSADSGTTVKVGVVGDSNEVWDQVVIPNLKKEGINVELVKFSDYIQPNEALAKGDIDLNAYQGYILMDDFNKTHDNALAAVGETVLNPISLYSDKAKKVEDIPEGSEVTIANDSVNAARGLLLLQSAGLIKLDYKEGANPTPDDIVSNPKNLKITEPVRCPTSEPASSTCSWPSTRDSTPSRTPSTSSRSTSSPSRTTTSSSPAPRIRTTPPTRRSWTPTAATTSRN